MLDPVMTFLGVTDLLAQTLAAQPPAGNGGGGAGPTGISTLLLIVAFIGIFYFVMFRDQRKKQKLRREMLDAVKKGDKVLTIGGVIGTIVGMKDNEVTIKVDEASNTKMTFVRSAVDRVLSGQEEA